MKKYTGMAAALLIAVCCMTGCGSPEKTSASDVKVSVESVNNMTEEELRGLYTGVWETSVVFINNQDGIQFDIDTYEFLEGGTGTYTPGNGEPEMLSWTVTPGGDLDVLFEEKGEKELLFEYISGNLVSLERDNGDTIETHLVKVLVESEEEKQ